MSLTQFEHRLDKGAPAPTRRALVASALLGPLSTLSRAQIAGVGAEFPNRPVSLVVPGPAGGSTDLVARVLGELLSAKWKQPVIVDNKPGATGVIGAESVMRGDASGHRLLFFRNEGRNQKES